MTYYLVILHCLSVAPYGPCDLEIRELEVAGLIDCAATASEVELELYGFTEGMVAAPIVRCVTKLSRNADREMTVIPPRLFNPADIEKEEERMERQYEETYEKDEKLNECILAYVDCLAKYANPLEGKEKCAC